MFFGVDVGGTKIQSALFNGKEMEFTQKISTPSDYTTFLEKITELFNQATENKSGKVKSVGIGIPGRTDKHHIKWVPNIPYLNGQHLANDLSDRLKVDVLLANDAQLALLGEVWKGAGKGKTNAVLMSLGTGIGGAIMVGGKIVRGSNSTAGAFGWINFDINATTRLDQGFLERHASGTALQKMGAQLNPPLTSYEVVKKAREEDPECLKIIMQIGEILGASLATVTSILDPEIVIVSGGLVEAFDLLYSPIKEKMRTLASPSVKDVDVVMSELGTHAGVYGAVRLAMLKNIAWI